MLQPIRGAQARLSRLAQSRHQGYRVDTKGPAVLTAVGRDHGAVGEAEEAVEGAVRQEAVDQQERAGRPAHGVPGPGAGALDGPGDDGGDGGGSEAVRE